MKALAPKNPEPEPSSSGLVSLFIPSLAGGGAERVMILLAGELAKRGFSVDLVLTSARGPYLSRIPAGVRVVDLRAKRIIFSLPALVRYLRKQRPLRLLSFLSPTNCLAVWGVSLARVDTRLILAEHNTASQALSSTPYRRLRLLPNIMRWTYPHADGLIANSFGVAEDLARVLKLGREQIHLVYNPVVTPELKAEAAQAVDHPWFYPGEPPVILGAGRLVEQKDFPTLLRAFALVRRRRRARLIIVGTGQGHRTLLNLGTELGVQNDFDLPGFVSDPYAYMARSGVFVLSSQWEGLGMVLIEAMACGTPVVSTDCPHGPYEILDGGSWGRLVPVGSPQSLAEAILATLEERGPDPRARAEYFSVERATDQYLLHLCPELE